MSSCDCVFCNFVIENKKYYNGNFPFYNGKYPFKPIHETRNTMSFLSIDFPAKVNVHILVIPKKHYQYMDEVPKSITHELADHINLIVKTLRKKYKGVNVLINNGEIAEQYVPHAHFHVIPRYSNDGLIIESWKTTSLSVKKFSLMQDEIRKEVKEILKSISRKIK